MKELIRDTIDTNAKDNIDYLKELFKNATDVVFREFNIDKYRAAIVYIDGMSEKNLLNEYLMGPLMTEEIKVQSPSEIKDKLITISDMKEIDKLSDGVNIILAGETLLFIDGLNVCYSIANRAWPNRGVGEPSAETVIRGSREGFTETVRFNTALVRRRIRDTRLKVEASQIGTRSKTDVVLMYIDDIVNKDVLEELKKRLDKISLDAILDSGYIEQYIEDNSNTPFPQVQSTERPDVVAAALYEGRIGIIVDGSPFALIVPAVLATFFQSPDDYYNRWLNASGVRIIRLIAIVVSLIMPAMYVAVTSFHTSIIPTKLAYAMAASREGVPFPSYIEVLFMELSLALLIEAITKLPKPIGSTIGIVGGLIMGQSAVSAGLISPIMVIIIGITAITTFLIPNYSVTNAFACFRILFVILSAIVGLYGIVVGVIFFLIHLTRIESFGIPYLSPAVNLVNRDLKDLYVRLPFIKFKQRPEFMKPQDKIRQK
ncbi:MAG: spore germination protein [Clostridium argentinense]|uniref:Spore germination protein n=1 Tax=Clostridium faecium TaxID=2762223 RepID=A0ABR8YS80_9CLOT|nr:MULTISPECIES: spore germination protein [Clostridium]MBD8047114.1 spore germination protein [Clostridium faecium]MBS5823595.1 spore germination protein [Clostridium argentinense]MDU1349612.1 spore germination protein [Clostridium argentinense]